MAVGMSLLPGAYGAPEATNDPNATAAPTAPVVAPATEGVMTATPARTEALTPATPPVAGTEPAPATEGAVLGQVMPGVEGAGAPVV